MEETRNLSLQDETFLSLTNDWQELLYCPLTWKECFEKFGDIEWVKNLKFKLTREPQGWRVYCLSILLGCVQTLLKDKEAATTFDSCEKLLEENKSEKFFEDIIEGLEHVLFSSKLFLFRMACEKDAADEILRRTKYFRDLNKVCQAAVFAVKAFILRHFGDDTKSEAFRCAKMAIELDPDEFGFRRGAWYFLAGKILVERRHTRSFSEMPSPEEIRLLERSLEKNPFPPHYPYVADVYREIVKACKGSSRQNWRQQRDNKQLLKKAKEMYEISVNNSNGSVAVLARCGIGLMKLPKPFKDLKLAKEALERAMITGSRRATIGMGNLLNWYEGDYKGALKYYEQAYSEDAIRAGLEIIKVKYKMDNNYNPVEDCEKFTKDLECMLEARQKLELTIAYCMMKAEYLLVKREDLLAAVREFETAINTHGDSKYLWESDCFFGTDSNCKVSNLISLEIRKAIVHGNLVEADENYLKKVFEKFPPHCRNYKDKKTFWRNRQ